MMMDGWINRWMDGQTDGWTDSIDSHIFQMIKCMD